MATKRTLDRAKAKTKKQKQLAIVLSVVLVVLLAVQGPKTMKLLQGSAHAPVVNSAASTVSTPTTPAPAPVSTPAPVTLSATSSSSSQLVSAVPAKVDAGQLRVFAQFASKDPFAAQVDASAGASTTSSGSAATAKAPKLPKAPKAPPIPPPTSAVISLNGELMDVVLNAAFPTSGATFDRVGSLFQLDALTSKSAKVSIVGGTYASGAPSLTLVVGTPVTLQDTADGARFTLVLEPAGTPIPPPPPVAVGALPTPTTTTTPAVP